VDRLAVLRKKLKEVKELHAYNSSVSKKRSLDSSNSEAGLKDATFLEIFAGAGGLTAAVRKAGLDTISACDIDSASSHVRSFDLLSNSSFKEIKKLIKRQKVRWLHLAPPCKTFSRARRRDRWAKVKKLRSATKPQGFEPKPRLVREANLLASRSAQLSRLQYKVNGWFSIENPASSYIWLYKPLAELAKLDGVRCVYGDQCMFGCEYRKPTGWLTNAPHFKRIAVGCPGGCGHNHPPLEGLVRDFWGDWVWKTSLASEYPQGLCETLAEEYNKAVMHHPMRPSLEFQELKEGGNNRKPQTSACIREQENDDCVGGLRNPNRSLQLVPGWYSVGSRLFWVLEDMQQRDSNYNGLLDCVGTDAMVGFDDGIAQLRNKISHDFDVSLPASAGLWSELLTRLVKDAGDPDSEAASWPLLGTPLGIEEEIIPGGVFPTCNDNHYSIEAERWSAVDSLVGAEGNYQTYDENQQDADALFIKELEKGFVDWSTDRKTLDCKYGPLVQSSIGVIVKNKKDGKKVRLVHDLRRSGVNQTIKCSERLVLPRLRDAVEDAMVLFESLEPGEQVGLMSLDFKDAFKQLPVRHSEKRYLSGHAVGGYFVYHVVLFGVRTGPLVWARIAALVARITQSMFQANRSRLQIYVDDPLIMMRGRPEQIHDMCCKILWLWLAIGLKISWNKGTIGNCVEWIGAHIELKNHEQLVALTVTEEKLDEWRRLLDRLDKRPTVSRKLLIQFTGKMSWAAGFLIQLKPFVRMLYSR